MPEARVDRMVGLFRSGHTLQQIGDEYGITRERVRQLIAREGVRRDEGGACLRTLANARYKKPQRNPDGRYIITYGCTREVAEALNGGLKVSTPKTPAHRYAMQRKNAKQRGIEWDITFPQWLEIWQKSGHFDERGRGQGYCMARYGDSGPYHPDNVEIITIGQNFSDSYIVHPWSERFAHVDMSKRKKSVCLRGHLRTPENLTKTGNCKECQRLRRNNLLPAAHAVYVSESSDCP